VGIYGVISYTVSQQFHEIGIRMAMGAHTRDVLGMVVRRGMALALTGVAIGWLATWGVSRLLASLLFQVETLDATSYLAATVVLVLVAFAATLLPALRAARIDPVTALRS
jgi:ABC-type antimicrobial peptide transport system permease subunit